eukprot:PITA_09738
MRMEDYSYQKDLYLPLGRKTKMLTGMTDEEWNLLDRKALGIVRLCLEASVAFNILKETTTEGLIKALEKLYEKPSASNKQMDITAIPIRFKEYDTLSSLGNSWPHPYVALPSDDEANQRNSNRQRQETKKPESGNEQLKNILALKPRIDRRIERGGQ